MKLTNDDQELSSAKEIVNKFTHYADNETRDLLDTLTVLENTKKANEKLERMRSNG